jgi:hypothetical protein
LLLVHHFIGLFNAQRKAIDGIWTKLAIYRPSFPGNIHDCAVIERDGTLRIGISLVVCRLVRTPARTVRLR